MGAHSDAAGIACIGLDLGGTTAQGGVVDPGGVILHREQVSTRASAGTSVVIETLAALATSISRHGERAGLRIIAAGIGSPGAVDPCTGTIIGAAPNLPAWVGVNLREPVESATGLPVIVDNDANMAALAEGAYGAARGCQHFVCLTLGTGIGAGVVVDGKLVRGSGFAAGEAGHMIVHEGGRRCECGSFGCLEAHASAGALSRMTRNVSSRLPRSALGRAERDRLPSAKEIFESAIGGDRLASELIHEVAAHLGAGVATIVSLLDPERIVLAGGMAQAGDDFILAVTTAAARRLMPVFARRLCVVRGALGSWAGVIGAAHAAMLDSTEASE